MSEKSAWRVTVDSPGDQQTLRALIAECRHRLADRLDAVTTLSVCERLHELGSRVAAETGGAARLVIDAERAAALPLAGFAGPSLSIEGLPARRRDGASWAIAI